MTKSKKTNEKNKPKDEDNVKKVISKTTEESPKNKKKHLKKLKKGVEEGLVDAPKQNSTEPAESEVKHKTNKKSKAKSKKNASKEAPNGNGQVEAKEVVQGDNTTSDKNDAKTLKKNQNKLNKKLKIAAAKENTAGLAAGPGKTVFVGNIPSNTKRVQLVKHFNSCGSILTVRFRTANGNVIYKHKMRKESAALNAYIVFDSVEAVEKALELNGSTLKGQILRVQKADKKETTSDPKRTILVGNLKYSATDDKLHQIFSSCGEIEYVRTLQGTGNEGCKGTAFVCFKNPDAVGLALELKGTMLDERPIHVERYSVNKAGANKKRIEENKTLESGKPNKEKFNGKKGAQKQNKGKNIQSNKSQEEKKKKSEFRGVKSEEMKKKPKKKISNQMKRLANKIAPKDLLVQ